MTAVRDLNSDPIRKAVLHTYNKFRAPIVGADGNPTASKLKYKQTAQALSLGYGLIVQPSFLKARVVRGVDCVRGGKGSMRWCTSVLFFLSHMPVRVAAAVCVRVCRRACCRVCVRVQRTLEEMCNSAQFQTDEEEYDSDAHKNLLMSRYPRSGPGMGQWSRDSGASAAPARSSSTALSSDAAHLGRQLQLIHGALVDMCSEMRIISGRALSGSRGTVARGLSPAQHQSRGERDWLVQTAERQRSVPGGKGSIPWRVPSANIFFCTFLFCFLCFFFFFVQTTTGMW